MALFLRAILIPFPDAIASMAADHHRHLGAVDGAGRGRRHRPEQHQAPDGLQLHRPYGLCAAGPGGGHGAGRAGRADLSRHLCLHQSRASSPASRRCGAAAGRWRPSPIWRAWRAPIPSWRWSSPCCSSAWRAFRRWPASSPNSMSSWPPSRRGLSVPAVLGVLASAIGLVYYLRLVKMMYFDEPAPAFDGDMALGSRSDPGRLRRLRAASSSSPPRR